MERNSGTVEVKSVINDEASNSELANVASKLEHNYSTVKSFCPARDYATDENITLLNRAVSSDVY